MSERTKISRNSRVLYILCIAFCLASGRLYGSSPQVTGGFAFAVAVGFNSSTECYTYLIAPDASFGKSPPTLATLPADITWLYGAPNGRAVYAISIGGDYLLQYKVDASGNLLPARHAKLAVPKPAGINFNPYRDLAYVFTDDGRLLAYDIGHNGELSRDDDLDIRPPPFTSPVTIAYSPGGKFMYVLYVYSNTAPMNHVGCIKAYLSLRTGHPKEVQLADIFNHIGAYPMDLIADGRGPYLYAFKGSGIDTYKIADGGGLDLIAKTVSSEGNTQTVDAVEGVRHFFIGLWQNVGNMNSASNGIVIAMRKSDGSVAPLYTYYADRNGDLSQVMPTDNNNLALFARLSYDVKSNILYALDVYNKKIYYYKLQNDGRLVLLNTFALFGGQARAKSPELDELLMIPGKADDQSPQP
jgi:6-phosphogluconolactonase (cycloisomerase 2 family)